ncbi:hypothetical protein R6Q57_019440 [Mikania cordata]
MHKLLSMIAGYNIIPRMGDLVKIHQYELEVLHALVSGQEMLSFRHLEMLNVWASRESKVRCMVPHCRLITALMRKQGALNPDTQIMKKQHKAFSFAKLSKEEWRYDVTTRYYVLMDKKIGQLIRGLKQNASPLRRDEQEELLGVLQDVIKGTTTDDVETMGGDDEEEEGSDHGGNEDHRRHASQEGRMDDDVIDAMVQSIRPREFDLWPMSTRMMWDRSSKESILAREGREREDRQARALAYNVEELRNDWFRQEEAVRTRTAFIAGPGRKSRRNIRRYILFRWKRRRKSRRSWLESSRRLQSGVRMQRSGGVWRWHGGDPVVCGGCGSMARATD